MVIIVVRFAETGKDYKYLLVNPNHYKINPKIVLRYVTGVSCDGPIYRTLWAVDTYKVEELPDIVTSQIVLLDEYNNIEIQKIGDVSTIPVPKIEKPKKEDSTTVSAKASAEARKALEKAKRRAESIVNYRKSAKASKALGKIYK